MPDVYFYEAFAEEEAELRQYLPARISAGYTDLTVQEAGHVEPPARLISIRTQSIVPADWARTLDGVLSRSTGFDHLLAYAAAAQTPVALGNLPLYCHRAVAEQAMLMWMALLRRLPRQMRQFHDFHRDGLTGAECQGRTLAVVGVGNIGREICDIGQSLRMRVLGVDCDPRHDDIDFVGVETALEQADVIACAMDLNETNRGYFDMAKWRRVKPGTIFVNISRGELSPSTGLVEALRAGLLGGVGLDVFDHESELAVALRTKAAPAGAEALAALELASRDDCICTPHNAFNTLEAVDRKSEHSVRQIAAFLETGQFLWPVVPK
jgi:D-lactate dehydrogenase